MRARALSALRRAATGTGTVTVRRSHLRALLAEYDRLTLRRESAEPLKIEEDCEPIAERPVPRDPVEVLAAACGAGWRRDE